MRTVGTLNAPPKSPNIFPTNAPSLSLSTSLIVAAFSPAAPRPVYPKFIWWFSMKITIIDGMSDGRTNIFRSSEAKAGLDRMDVAILGLLQNNARLSVKEIAAEVALAPSSTHERIKRMRDFGVLRGTHAEVDPKALGVGLEALFMIELSKHQRGTVDQFMDDIAGGAGGPRRFSRDRPLRRRGARGRAGYAAFEGPRPRPVHEPARGHPHRDLDHLRGPPPVPTPGLSNGRLNS